MSTNAIVGAVTLGVVVIGGMVYMGTYNGFQRKDESITSAERKIASCYQKRADMIGNLESSVERIMKQEKDVVIGNANARNTNKLPDNATPEQISEFIKSQSSTMTRLNAVVESVPSVATAVNMLAFQKDLKNQEQQCNILRTRYIDDVKSYNVSVRSFPANIVANMHGYTAKKQIEFDDEAQNKRPPRVFGTK